MCDCGEELVRRNQAARRRGPGGVGGGNDHDVGRGSDHDVGVGKDHGAGGGNYHATCGGEEHHGKSGRNRGGRGGKPGRGGGRTGDGASNRTEYWTNIIGGTTILTGLFALLYKTFDLGTLWRDKVNGIWGGVLDFMCHNYVKEPCAGLRINDCRRKWTAGSLLEATPPSPSEPCQATIIIELDDD